MLPFPIILSLFFNVLRLIPSFYLLPHYGADYIISNQERMRHGIDSLFFPDPSQPELPFLLERQLEPLVMVALTHQRRAHDQASMSRTALTEKVVVVMAFRERHT